MDLVSWRSFRIRVMNRSNGTEGYGHIIRMYGTSRLSSRESGKQRMEGWKHVRMKR